MYFYHIYGLGTHEKIKAVDKYLPRNYKYLPKPKIKQKVSIKSKTSVLKNKAIKHISF